MYIEIKVIVGPILESHISERIKGLTMPMIAMYIYKANVPRSPTNTRISEPRTQNHIASFAYIENAYIGQDMLYVHFLIQCTLKAY